MKNSLMNKCYRWAYDSRFEFFLITQMTILFGSLLLG